MPTNAPDSKGAFHALPEFNLLASMAEAGKIGFVEMQTITEAQECAAAFVERLEEHQEAND